MESETDNRHAIISAARLMNAPGFNQVTSGKVSFRHQDRPLITATGCFCVTMTTDDFCFADADGQVRGLRSPSGAWRCHRGFVRTPARQLHLAPALGETPFESDFQIEPAIDKIAGLRMVVKNGP